MIVPIQDDAAIASTIVVLFLFPTPSVVHYRLTISLLCFALSSVAGLLFAANVEIKGSVGKLSLTLAGPAALWVATLIIFGAIFPGGVAAPREGVRPPPESDLSRRRSG